MSRLVLAAFVVSAIALIGGGATKYYPPPPYTSYTNNYRQAIEKVLKLTPSPYGEGKLLKADDPELHYGLLVATLLNIVKTMSDPYGPTYSFYYLEGVQEGVQIGWSDPNGVGQANKDEISRVNAYLKPILELVESCLQTQRVGCDNTVQSSVLSNVEKYERPAKLLGLVGVLSEVYLTNTFEEEARQHNIVKLLVEGEEKLKMLVQKAVAVRTYANDYYNSTAEAYIARFLN